MLQFLLNDIMVEEENLAPDLTVLDYLRNHRQLTGTKEGCASGDCGACTAVLVSVQNAALVYRSLNTCITFVGSLHGKQLITVEYLAIQGSLHPVQQAMVDFHGSQCGFCTPGFVMSTFALQQNVDCSTTSDHQQHEMIEEYLGGNLCRCTGYRPIIQAAKSVLELPSADDQRFSAANEAIIGLLESIAPRTHSGGFYRPTTVDQVCTLRSSLPAARLLAGGTDLALEITQKLDQFDDVISLKEVTELDYCHCESDQWRIGAAFSLTDFLVRFGPLCSDLESVMKRFGSMQIRNQGTVGGNIANASPVGDLAPVLIALQGKVVLQSKSGQRVVELQDFFVSYKNTLLADDEIVREIRIPATVFSDQWVTRIYKISKRAEDDISAVLAAFHVQMIGDTVSDLRVAFGGMAAIPKRAQALENALRGRELTADTILKAQQAIEKDFQPISDARASAEYRLQVSKNLLQRLAIEINQTDVQTRVSDYVES